MNAEVNEDNCENYVVSSEKVTLAEFYFVSFSKIVNTSFLDMLPYAAIS